MIRIVACLLVLLCVASAGLAVIPNQINYQGFLASPAGIPLDTAVSMTFAIYSAESGGAPIWQETHPAVTVVAGIFRAQLGSITSIPDMFYPPVRYLGITVGSNSEMVPRHFMTSVPYAYRVETVDKASGGEIFGTLNAGSNNTHSNTAFVFGSFNAATGDYSTVSGGRDNTAGGENSVVGGGSDNLASGVAAAISGGGGNTAGGLYSVVGGRFSNSASGFGSAIAGGQSNVASGSFSFASGTNVSAAGNYSTAMGANVSCSADSAFAWSDGSGPLFSIGSGNTFNVKANGGVRLWTTANHADNIGARLPAGQSAWTTLSDSTKKRNRRNVNTKDVLDKLCQMPIQQWSYFTDPTVEHVGPMAQDFWRLFQLGGDSLSISTIDPAGVALAAIQELAIRNNELEIQVAQLQAQLQSLMAAQQESTR